MGEIQNFCPVGLIYITLVNIEIITDIKWTLSVGSWCAEREYD